jgi:peptide/nickel transport system permease protein
VAGYVVRRLLAMFGMLIALSMTVFLLFALVPTDVARLTCGKACTPEVIQANRERLGLDQPLYEQYWHWVKGIVVGRTYGSGTQTFDCSAPCLGYSFRQGEEVTVLIKEALPVTISLAFGAFIIWMVVGIAVGIFAALRRGTWADKSAMGVALAGYSMPSFFIGLLLYFFFILKLGVLPPPHYENIWVDPQAWFQTLLLPWISLAILNAAFYSRLTRGQMLETLGDDFVRTARAKGLKEGTVITRHAFRAGLSPLVTAAGLDLAGLLGGAIITETIFSLPGIGSLSIRSVLDYDLPVIVGVTLVAATFVIVANLIVDLLYALIDPRVRLT